MDKTVVPEQSRVPVHEPLVTLVARRRRLARAQAAARLVSAVRRCV